MIPVTASALRRQNMQRQGVRWVQYRLVHARPSPRRAVKHMHARTDPRREIEREHLTLKRMSLRETLPRNSAKTRFSTGQPAAPHFTRQVLLCSPRRSHGTGSTLFPLQLVVRSYPHDEHHRGIARTGGWLLHCRGSPPCARTHSRRTTRRDALSGLPSPGPGPAT